MVAAVLKEWFVVICISFHHMATGFVLAFPSALTPVITGNHTDIHATKDEASWFVAVYGMTGPVGYLLIPPLMQKYGRRITNVIINMATIVGSVVIALASDVTTLIIGRCIQGTALGGLHICCILTAEYTHPKRRGYFIVFKMSWISMGELICHSLVYTLTWRQLAWLTALPAALGAIGTLKWPDSPAWYAYKGRYEECIKAFEWLRGDDLESKKELKELILTQQELKKLNNSGYGDSLTGALKAFRRKEFLKPLYILLVSSVLIHATGVYFFAAYIIEIMTTLTGDKSKAFYYTFCFDAFHLVAYATSFVVIRSFNRRTILFVSGAVSVLFLGLLCILNYLEQLKFIHLSWLTPLLLIIYSFICNVGIMPISVVSKGELFPLKYRGIGVCSIGIYFSLLSLLILKIMSKMLIVLHVYGTFTIYIVIMIVALIILYFIQPETKDRTLQDIETDFIGIKLSEEQIESELVNMAPLVSTVQK